MRFIIRCLPIFAVNLAFDLLFMAPSLALAEPADAERGMVATVNPLATEAGQAALKNGGNAVDAAVAAALTLGVVDSHNSGVGGGCFILIRRADGKLIAIDGRETAPAKAHRDMFLRDGRPDTELSQTGPLASGVPGAVAAYSLALEENGRLKLGDLLLPAAKIAEDGFALDRICASRIKEKAGVIARFEATRKILLKPDGSPYREGEILKQPDLARTYQALAKHGPDWFYRGEFAERTSAWMAGNGGFLTAEDFAAYRAKLREPLVTKYREYTIVGFPPPSSGGVHVAQMLNILEPFDLKSVYRQDRADFVHLVTEAMRPAFADRAHWLGDADFAKVPRGLVDKRYAAGISKLIDPARTGRLVTRGEPPAATTELFEKHTTHIAAADAEGNWVGITATVNTTFGSKVIVPGLGVIMNNQMDDFSISPGVPNAFGLMGGEANAIEPGKRPLSSMSPTIVLKDERPVMTVGAAGGPKIITQALLTIVNHLDLDMPLAEAVAAPRFHHQWSPNELSVESNFPAPLVAQLREKGHVVKTTASVGVTQAIGVSDDGKTLIGVSDPRVPGKAAGW